MTGLLALAFSAGLLAPVNPCGFGLLPAVLTAAAGNTGPDASRGLGLRLAGGLRAGLALSIGFTSTFTAIGLGLTAGLRSLITLMPWLAAAFGLVLVLVGLAMLAGWHLPLRWGSHQPDTHRATTTGRMIVFGAGYAVASASCTLAVLLAVVTQAAATTAVGALAVFSAYAAGSATLLITLALVAVAAGGVLSHWVRRAARFAARIAGAVLALSGGYLLYFWLPQLIGDGRPFDAGLSALAARITTWISTHQLPVVVAAAALILTAAAAVVGAGLRRPTSADCCPPKAEHHSHDDTADQPHQSRAINARPPESVATEGGVDAAHHA